MVRNQTNMNVEIKVKSVSNPIGVLIFQVSELIISTFKDAWLTLAHFGSSPP